jgi:hypothetical protein
MYLSYAYLMVDAVHMDVPKNYGTAKCFTLESKSQLLADPAVSAVCADEVLGLSRLRGCRAIQVRRYELGNDLVVRALERHKLLHVLNFYPKPVEQSFGQYSLQKILTETDGIGLWRLLSEQCTTTSCRSHSHTVSQESTLSWGR